MPRRQPSPEEKRKAAIQFTVALVIVLAGIYLGYKISTPHEGPRPLDKPTALGYHPPPMPRPATNDTNSLTKPITNLPAPPLNPLAP